MSQFFNTIKQHYKSVMILRKNPELLERYNMAPMSLYTLDCKQSTNMKLQDDYNNLHKDYKYHSILYKDEVPLSILLANPKYIKNLIIYGRKIFNPTI